MSPQFAASLLLLLNVPTANVPVALAATANGGPNLDRISIDNAVNVINVSTSTELRSALSEVQPGQMIRLAPGTYHGSSTPPTRSPTPAQG